MVSFLRAINTNVIHNYVNNVFGDKRLDIGDVFTDPLKQAYVSLD
jgi:hypothetical protein